MLLLAPSGGLEFVASSPAVSQLRISVAVGSEAIDFLFPVLGSADFIAELISGRHISTHLHTYGNR